MERMHARIGVCSRTFSADSLGFCMPKPHSKPTPQSRPARRREAHDPIPSNAISLTHAFDQLFKKVDEHPDIVGKFNSYWSAALAKAREWERNHQDLSVFDVDLEAYCHHGKEANVLLREGLETGKLTAYVCDPKSHEWKDLGRKNWFSKYWDEYVPWMIYSDHVDPESFEHPGPEAALVKGLWRPVFFDKRAFRKWLDTLCGKRRGRKKGSGSYEKFDEPYVIEMRKLVKAGQVSSPFAAAKTFAPRAKGGPANQESTAKRLLARYSAKYPNRSR